MLNYIKAELYRNFNRSYFWVYTGSIAILALLLNILCTLSTARMDLGQLFAMTTQVLILPVFLVAAFIDIATGEEIKNLTMKNAVAFGVPRSSIALSKVIVTVTLSVIAALIIFTVFFGSGAILFGVGEGSAEIIKAAALRILAAMPLWIGAISIGTFLALVINNNTLAAFAYAGVFTVTATALKILALLVSDKFSYVSKFLITTNLSGLRQPDLGNGGLLRAAGIGIVYTILFTAMSMLYIKRKEIK